MSRGLGRLQNRVIAVLAEAPPSEAMLPREIRVRVGADGSNLRRAIRTLIARGCIEAVKGDDGRERLKLGFWMTIAATLPPEKSSPPADPLAELRRWRAGWEEEKRQRALRRERARQEAAEVRAEQRRKRRPRRRRRIGPVQERILAVLAQGIDGEFRALKTTYLKSLVGGDRSNLRRAIRSLLEQGLIEERIVAGWRYYDLTLFGYIRAVPLDPATAPKLLDLP